MKLFEKNEVIKFFVEIIVVVVVTIFIFHSVIIPVKVDGDSMYPTVHDEDNAIVNAINLDEDGIKRFDIIVLQCDQLNKKIIKRVIGLPGDVIVYRNDKLYINGIYYEENFLNQEYIKEAKKQYNFELFTNDFEATVGEGEVFVLGDNRIKSSDSRVFGTFKYSSILGKEGMIVFPFNRIKWLF